MGLLNITFIKTVQGVIISVQTNKWTNGASENNAFTETVGWQGHKNVKLPTEFGRNKTRASDATEAVSAGRFTVVPYLTSTAFDVKFSQDFTNQKIIKIG